MRFRFSSLHRPGGCTRAATPAGSQAAQRDAEGHAWWRHAVFYEIYPRSFGAKGLDAATARPLIQSAASGDVRSVKLAPYGIFMAEVK
jgi:hypothetical protein